MATGSQKKEEEQRLVKSFMAHKGWDVFSVCSDEPDVHISTIVDGKRLVLGIEVTECGNQQQWKWQQQWQQVCDDIFQGLSNDPSLSKVYLKIIPDRSRLPNRINAASIILSLVRNHVAAYTTGGPKEATLRDVSLSRCGVRVVCVACIPGLLSPVVDPPAGGGAGTQWHQIWTWAKHAVDKKAKKLQCYKLQNVDEVWLLLCAAGLTPTRDNRGFHNLLPPPEPFPFIPPPCELIDCCCQSGFDRVFLWDSFGRRSWEL